MDPTRKDLFFRLLICWLGTVHGEHGWIFSMCIVVSLRIQQRRRLCDVVSSSTNCRLGHVLPSLSCRLISPSASLKNFHARSARLKKLVTSSDATCYNLIRMHRRTFDRLGQMVDTIGGLKFYDNVPIDEQVAICLHILALPATDRVIRFNSGRSGKTISKCFHSVIDAIVKLNGTLTKKPEPVPEDSTDETWKWFKVNIIWLVTGSPVVKASLHHIKAKHTAKTK